LEEIIFENFNIYEYDIISVKLAKVLGYITNDLHNPIQAQVYTGVLLVYGSVNVDECTLSFTHSFAQRLLQLISIAISSY
jgi:hypothetical protein